MIYKINFQKKLKIMHTKKNFSLTINGQQEAESEARESEKVMIREVEAERARMIWSEDYLQS